MELAVAWVEVGVLAVLTLVLPAVRYMGRVA